MWLFALFRRVIFPVPVILNRFAAVLFVLIFGIFFRLCLRSWVQKHDHLSSFKRRSSLDNPDLGQVIRKLLHLHFPKVCVWQFPWAEHTDDPDFVACR